MVEHVLGRLERLVGHERQGGNFHEILLIQSVHVVEAIVVGLESSVGGKLSLIVMMKRVRLKERRR